MAKVTHTAGKFFQKSKKSSYGMPRKKLAVDLGLQTDLLYSFA